MAQRRASLVHRTTRADGSSLTATGTVNRLEVVPEPPQPSHQKDARGEVDRPGRWRDVEAQLDSFERYGTRADSASSALTGAGASRRLSGLASRAHGADPALPIREAFGSHEW